MPAAALPPDGITLRDVSLTLSGRPVLRGISLHLTEHRIGIIGRNGSGKTTLLRVMAGLVAPTSGRVGLGDIDPARDRRAVLRRIGILFQNPDQMILFPTVAEELAFGLIQQGQSKLQAEAAAAALLAAEGRSHWAQAPVSTLSQGQRHYLCLLSVLLMAPDTILLDEPLAGLDLPTQIRLARRFARLPQRVITITHDPDAVASADRVIWIDRGAVRLDGPAPQVLAAFRAAMEQAGASDADTDLTG